MNKTDYPQIFGSNLALYTETNYMAICGKVPEFVDVDRKLTALANQAYKDKMMMAKEYRHRAIVWGVQSHFYMDFLLWILNCWGIVPLTDMLSMLNTEMIAEEDTPQNREKAYYDMAWLTENTPPASGTGPGPGTPRRNGTLRIPPGWPCTRTGPGGSQNSPGPRTRRTPSGWGRCSRPGRPAGRSGPDSGRAGSAPLSGPGDKP